MSKSGFTVVEVVLVLAISMFLFVGIIGGTSINITRQRYNDAVNDFAEFLRRQYSEVISVENPRSTDINKDSPCTVTSKQAIGNDPDPKVTKVETGRSNCLVYGKLITFNEGGDPAKVHTYDIIGDARSPEEITALNETTRADSSSTLDKKVKNNDVLLSLINLNAGVLTARKDGSGNCQIVTAGNSYTYELPWDAYVQNVNHPKFASYKSAIMIVRSPLSGAISTFRIPATVPVQSLLGKASSKNHCNTKNSSRIKKYNKAGKSLRAFLSDTDNPPNPLSGKTTGLLARFCINSEDVLALANGSRRMVSIAYDGYDASAVKVYNQDQEENACQ